MRASVLLLAPLLACGSSSSAPRAPGNTTATPVAASLADDVAALTRAADPSSVEPWIQRATFLGWTATDQAAFRLLICAADPLGGRGDYCDLEVCVAERASGQQVPPPGCESAAALELHDSSFDPAAATAAADASVAKLGALAAGTPGAIADAGLAIERGTLFLAAAGGPRRVVHAPFDDEEASEMSARATGVTADYVGTSPDGACRVVLGRFTFLGWYEGVTGDVPRGFAVVTCD